MHRVNSGLAVGFFLNLFWGGEVWWFFFFNFSNQWQCRGGKENDFCLGASSHHQPTGCGLASHSAGEAGLRSCQIFTATTGKCHMKERRRIGVKTQLLWLDVQGGGNTSEQKSASPEGCEYPKLCWYLLPSCLSRSCLPVYPRGLS